MPRADPQLDEASDEALATRAAAGDEQAFTVLMTRHRQMAHAVCLRVTGNPEDALDALQETLVRVWRHLGGFRDDARFTTWLYRVTVNAALEEARRNRRHATFEPGDALAAAPAAPMDERVAERIEVAEALAMLPPHYRAAIVLRECCDLPYEEIAAVLEIPLNTVKSRISRARQALLAQLSPARAGKVAG